MPPGPSRVTEAAHGRAEMIAESASAPSVTSSAILWPPWRARSSGIVACVSTFPWFRMATESQTRSTSPRMWEEKKIVARPRRASIMSSTSLRPIGSSALVGSSSSSRRGAFTSAWAIPSRCFMPREYPPILVVTPPSPAVSSSIAVRCTRMRCSSPNRPPTKCMNSVAVIHS